jgi:hypothetical protein
MNASCSAAIVCLFISIAAGCGPSGETTYPVVGEVRFQGQPVPRGYISFVPADGVGKTDAGKIADGRYDLQVRPGAKKVEISATKDNGPVDPVMGQAPQKQYIPDKYNVQTTLKVEVKNEDNNFDFELKG